MNEHKGTVHTCSISNVALHTYHCMYWLCVEPEQGCFPRLGGPLLPLAAAKSGPQNERYCRSWSAIPSEHSEGDPARLCGCSESCSVHEVVVSGLVRCFSISKPREEFQSSQ